MAGIRPQQAARGDKLERQHLKALQDALAQLAKKGAVAITSSGGVLQRYQRAISRLTALPCAISPLMQSPLLSAVLRPNETVLVLSGGDDATSTKEMLGEMQRMGVPDGEAKRFTARGLGKLRTLNALGFGNQDNAQPAGATSPCPPHPPSPPLPSAPLRNPFLLTSPSPSPPPPSPSPLNLFFTPPQLKGPAE